jgi:hypothetical protein
MKRSAVAVGALVSGAVSLACGVSVTRSQSSSTVSHTESGWEQDTFRDLNDLLLDHTMVRGALGKVSAIEHEATAVSSLDQAGFSKVELITQAEGWAAMVVVTVQGGLGHADLAPGAVRQYGLEAPLQDTDVTVMGCSGPEVDDWEYDENADEVTVRISALPSGRRRADLTAIWRDPYTDAPLHQVDTSFEFAPPDHGPTP